MKNLYQALSNETGFALITAVMLLFAATVMGLMVMNSAEIEILLSGAQQRYEDDFNTVEGASSFEAAAVGQAVTVTNTIDGTDYTRSYVVADPSNHNTTLSPTNPALDIFNPYGSTAVSRGVAANWPMANLMR
ncbi:MAG: pilus assembly PilX N-terminal domain-containing protein, partial [Desulfuromonadales bacterium]|nr:pilus assembly PilX N-terminal domain-containing protein [Desulfuromonadales bacterium]